MESRGICKQKSKTIKAQHFSRPPDIVMQSVLRPAAKGILISPFV
jgi:hypothetical protein